VQILLIEVSRGAPHLSKGVPASAIHLYIVKTLISGGILSAKAAKFNLVRDRHRSLRDLVRRGGLCPQVGKYEDTLAALVLDGRRMALVAPSRFYNARHHEYECKLYTLAALTSSGFSFHWPGYISGVGAI
jgi:hypothetical protein